MCLYRPIGWIYTIVYIQTLGTMIKFKKTINMTNVLTPGDIIIGTHKRRNEAYHPIIYLGEIDETFFSGVMLTHDSRQENIELVNEHFEQKIDNDERPSFFVGNYLIKKQEWGPFHKVGKLSEIGLQHIHQNLDGTEPLIWEGYITG